MKLIFDNIKQVMALLIIVFGFAFLFTVLILFRHDAQLVGISLTGVITTIAGATGYYYGSSQGMAKANEQLALNSGNAPTVENADTVNVKK